MSDIRPKLAVDADSVALLSNATPSSAVLPHEFTPTAAAADEVAMTEHPHAAAGPLHPTHLLFGKYEYDEELAEMLEEELCVSLPFCPGLGKLKPSSGLIINSLLFLVPLLWSALKPLWFISTKPLFVNYDYCTYDNTSSGSGDNRSDAADSLANATALLPILDCMRCNGLRASLDINAIPGTGGTSQFTFLAGVIIVLRIVFAANIALWVYSRSFLDRILAVRLLAARIVPIDRRKTVKTRVIGDMMFVLSLVLGITFQLTFLRDYGATADVATSLGRCVATGLSDRYAEGAVVYAHYNESTLRDARLESGTSIIFTWATLALPFVLGPLRNLFRQSREPLCLLSSSALGDPEHRLVKKLAAVSAARGPMIPAYVGARSVWSTWKRLCRRGFCEFVIDISLATSPPIPLNYWRRLRRAEGSFCCGAPENVMDVFSSGAHPVKAWIETEMRDDLALEFELVEEAEFHSQEYQSGLRVSCLVWCLFALLILASYVATPARPDLSGNNVWSVYTY